VAATISGRHDFPFLSEYELDAEVREFDVHREDDEYVWHRDEQDRECEIIEGDGWQFQYHNCLPYLLEKGMIFDIPKGEYHRLIRGVNNLKVRIIKKDG
tara:strand:+ start:569 stop:865 length:297 start_codon:yes stop_codon:yes gene_type:complete